MSPCEWPVDYAGCGDPEDVYAKFAGDSTFEPDRLSAIQRAREKYEAYAVELLWERTRRVFGVCEETIRPCRVDCANGDQFSTFWGRGPGFDPGFPRMGSRAWSPVLIGGRWTNMTCGCAGGCRCDVSGPTVLRLPGPVQEVTEVRIDGVLFTDYRLLDKSRLVRTDGEEWPRCQNLLADASEPDTFTVTYRRGVPTPVGGQMAAGRLALELARAACDDNDCALPDNWQTLTRQGISISTDPASDGTQFTGIWSIDEWVKTYSTVPRTVTVMSPDFGRRR